MPAEGLLVHLVPIPLDVILDRIILDGFHLRFHEGEHFRFVESLQKGERQKMSRMKILPLRSAWPTRSRYEIIFSDFRGPVQTDPTLTFACCRRSGGRSSPLEISILRQVKVGGFTGYLLIEIDNIIQIINQSLVLLGTGVYLKVRR